MPRLWVSGDEKCQKSQLLNLAKVPEEEVAYERDGDEQKKRGGDQWEAL